MSIRKEQKGDCLQIHLSGALDENLSWERELGPVNIKAVHINCKEVTRINAVGARSWIRYLQDLRNKGIEISFVQCSTAVIEQMNLISNFNCGGRVESLAIPFFCAGCRTDLVAWLRTQQIERIRNRIPDMKCPKCEGKVKFDDIAEDYFGFLDRNN
jgi:anti-anti-sigma regulatory factor/endogenous inhibitor of DNA gyrase (YacG/DUF329 family)